MNQQGGYINTSYVSILLKRLSTNHNQTPEIKKTINNSIFNTGHGSVFLGTSAGYEGGDKNIRILVGAHFSDDTLKIGAFGGRCNKGEPTIETVIRETIEEIFNFFPTLEMIKEIRHFLDENTELYFILNLSENCNAYSYFFDVSILADFIRIISRYKGIYVIPTFNGPKSLGNYYIDNIQYRDLSSFGDNISGGSGSTIKLSDFLRDRFISKSITQDGLNEISYLSFPALKNLVDNKDKETYNIYIFGTKERKLLPMRSVLIKLLKNDIMKEILSSA